MSSPFMAVQTRTALPVKESYAVYSQTATAVDEFDTAKSKVEPIVVDRLRPISKAGANYYYTNLHKNLAGLIASFAVFIVTVIIKSYPLMLLALPFVLGFLGMVISIRLDKKNKVV